MIFRSTREEPDWSSTRRVAVTGFAGSCGREANPCCPPVGSDRALLLATLNVVGGYVVTDRMLQMFKKKKK